MRIVKTFYHAKSSFFDMPHRIHGTGIFTYIWLICMVDVGVYIYIYHTWILWVHLYFSEFGTYFAWDFFQASPEANVKYIKVYIKLYTFSGDVEGR